MVEHDFDDLAPIEEIVKWKGQRFLLREASAAAAAKHKSAVAKTFRMVDGKLAGMDDVGEVEPLLVSLCLFKMSGEHVLTDRAGNPISVELHVIKQWPSRVTSKLFDRIKEISPTIEDTPTEESLVKAIEKLQEQLARIREAKGAGANGSGGPEGNGQGEGVYEGHGAPSLHLGSTRDSSEQPTS